MASTPRKLYVGCYFPRPEDLRPTMVKPAERARLLGELQRLGVITREVQKSINMKNGGFIQTR
jgi:hypothetical protein